MAKLGSRPSLRVEEMPWYGGRTDNCEDRSVAADATPQQTDDASASAPSSSATATADAVRHARGVQVIHGEN